MGKLDENFWSIAALQAVRGGRTFVAQVRGWWSVAASSDTKAG